MKSNNLVKKIGRKRDKAYEILNKNEPSIELSHEITNNLLVLNGGLLNEINKEQIYELFTSYGIIKTIVMRLGKSYSFITFMNSTSASRAMKDLNGQDINVNLKKPNVRFYLYYVNTVPNNEEYLTNGKFPPGLFILEDFICKETEQDLLNCIFWDENDGEILKHRRVKHYGARFNYLTNNVDRSGCIGEIPKKCMDLLQKMLVENIISCIPDQLTINQYQPGQGIPSHVDTHSAFEDEIIVISLQSQIIMDFTHPNGGNIPVLLKERSLSVMKGESRYLWSHGITPRHYDIIVDESGSGANIDLGLTSFKRGIRTSFTFRKIRNGPCKCHYSEQCDSQSKQKEETFKLKLTEEEAAKLETKHVHQVYEKIANHFSDTRHSCWPRVVDFINSLSKNSLVLDCGCGNGKYLHLRKRVLYMVGCDRSFNLCQICRSKNFEVFVGDALSLPFRNSYFDAVISIAVIHHFANQSRRLESIKELLRVIRSGGLCLIYVWALEQKHNNVKSKYLKLGHNDKLENKSLSKSTKLNEDDLEVNLMYSKTNINPKQDSCENELLSNVETNLRVNDTFSNTSIHSNNTETIGNDPPKLHDTPRNLNNISSNNKINNDDTINTARVEQLKEAEYKLPTHSNRTDFQSQDVFVPWHNRSETDNCGDIEKRYYHVYKAGELVEECDKLSDLSKVVECYYDQGNWCVVLQKI